MTSGIIPFFIFIIILFGMLDECDVWRLFADGVNDGLKMIFNLFPVLLGLFLGVSLLRSSGILEFFANAFGYIFTMANIPKELISLIALKPFSGSASIAIFTELIENYHPDSLISFSAAIIMGSTETLIYAISIYSSKMKGKLSYKVVILAFLSYFLSVYLSCFLARIFI